MTKVKQQPEEWEERFQREFVESKEVTGIYGNKYINFGWNDKMTDRNLTNFIRAEIEAARREAVRRFINMLIDHTEEIGDRTVPLAYLKNITNERIANLLKELK